MSEPGALKTILIVDDSQTVLMMHRLLLADLKEYRLVFASDGAEAVTLAGAHAPDLILMDVQMPLMDGFEATRRIRALPGMQATPIILVTSRDAAASAIEGYAAGCDDYLVKPFERSALLTKLAKHLDAPMMTPAP